MTTKRAFTRRPGMAAGIADVLRTQIRAGSLAPGQRLVEAEVMDSQDATRGAVRSAFDILAAEGLVERVPNKGARVREVTTTEAISILECRRVLEGLIARDAALNLDAEHADRLGRALASLRDAADAGDLPRYSELDQQLHQAIADASGQTTAAELIHRLRSQIVRHQFRLALRPERTAQSLTEHDELVAAILAGNSDEAERLARRHLDSVITALKTTGHTS